MDRLLAKSIKQSFTAKMILLAGPRQVGKTTLTTHLVPKNEYLNFDILSDREVILKQEWNRQTNLVILDELHKMKNWKTWLKGIYDKEKNKPPIIVTGSARLDTYRKGGDSLAGRHLMYHLHPLTVKELKKEMPADTALELILRLGGFPEPLLNGSTTYSKRWRKSHLDSILREDLLDLEKVREIKSIETLIMLLKSRVGSPVAYASLAGDLQVSIPTVKHWLEILERLYVIFAVRPYSHNIARSLLKESKYYFYDTGAVMEDDGKRIENLVACALSSELDFLADTAGEDVMLCYLRDKDKREVDFLCVINGRPTNMIEVKWNSDNFDANLFHFMKILPKTKAHQISRHLSRTRSSNGAQLQAAAEYLQNLELNN